MSQFQFEYANMGSSIAVAGDVEWDKSKKQWKATITSQHDPEIRFEAWDDDGLIAGLMCVSKWCGRDLSDDHHVRFM